jgi:multidrug resistance efflux pump
MSNVEIKAGDKPVTVTTSEPMSGGRSRRRRRILSLSITLAAIGLAAVLTRAMWDTYMAAPWTRDGTVRAYVVVVAPEIAGRIVKLPVADNQMVRKGDLLMQIDPTDYQIAVSLAEAASQRAQVTTQNAERESGRRQQLSALAVTQEEQQTFEANASAAQAQYREAVAKLEQAQVNLRRTEIRSPVNGWITNLSAQLGDYVTVGKNEISLINADSFWVDAYFEETYLASIREGEPASIKLMGYGTIVRGRVDSVARGINVGNALPDSQGLATVSPIFTWVRLAQRIPIRIRIGDVPNDVRLVAGMTATVQLDPR